MNKQKKNIFVDGAISPSRIADSIAAHASKKNIGAHSLFLGQIRADQVNGKTVAAIDYSSYEALAIDKMDEIRNEIFEKHELTCMHVYHSLGTVRSGEICLFVFTSSGHRKAATAACEEIVERIKKELPIWGKELFEDETHQWKINN
ncbi:molybdenum cofactor biosynthesis protein MoaE [Sphingobacterium faecium]|uniref:molybdenum cofactor biosynthesis protein MoaE n=1 Tax=Sphingobacterium faecium TaxID=34087 RepID=UPI0024682AEF|nr:molybdenum cofactor biosynthesis protein MoaE [Sphingobacterium faecium]MDH5827013.1 molybdenum cofactor biosynthesis protein MoaE [Sphingobacterium faecium]